MIRKLSQGLEHKLGALSPTTTGKVPELEMDAGDQGMKIEERGKGPSQSTQAALGRCVSWRPLRRFHLPPQKSRKESEMMCTMNCFFASYGRDAEIPR